MAEFSLHIPRKVSENEEIITTDRRMQSCVTRATYAHMKKNGLHDSATEMIASGSDVQNLIKSRNATKDLNYWLIQAAIKRAAWLDSANEEVRKKDDKEEARLLKEKNRILKQIDKIEKKFENAKEKIREAREELPLAKTEKKRQSLKKKINDNLSYLSKADDERKKLATLKSDLKKTEKKLKKIDETRKKNYTTVFGGRDEFIERCNGIMSHDDFVRQRLMSLYSIGDTEHGNRLFDIRFDGVVYKPSKDVHVFIEYDFDKLTEQQKIELARLIMCVEEGMCPVTVTVTDTHVNLSADTIWLYINERKNYKPQHMRFASVDANPQEYSLAIADWKSSGKYDIKYTNVFSFKSLFDAWFELNEEEDVASDDQRRIFIQHKIEFETLRIARLIAILAEHYKVEYLIIENLKIESEDIGNKVSNTKCINLWKRDLFFEVLEKECTKRGIRFLKVKPEYSSFEGNIIFRKHLLEPDMNMAALELGRRGYEYVTQHILHTKQPMKNIIFPEVVLFNTSFEQSMEELGYNGYEFRGWKSFFVKVTKSGTMYRRRLGDIKSPGMTRFYSRQAEVL